MSNFLNKIFIIVLCFFLTVICKAIVFNSPRQILLPIAQYAVASGDLNNDGIPDLIIGGDPIFPDRGKIRVGLGLGNGNFSNWREYEIGYNPNFFGAPFVSKIELADFNNDGNLDVVVAHNSARSQFSSTELIATILFGDGQGVLQPAQAYRFFDATPDNYVSTLTIADLNADGFLDIILGIHSGNLGKVCFMKNLGNNSFAVIGARTVIGRVNGLGTAHFNNDSHIDVIYATSDGIGIMYMDGNFFSNMGILVEEHGQNGEMIVKDFNSDGRTDFVVAGFFNHQFRVFLQNQNGFPATPVIYNTKVTPERMKGYDVNRDGYLDLVFGDGLSGGIQFFYGNADGTFAPGEQTSGAPLSDITLNDFDLNGKTDIVTANYSTVSNLHSQILLNAPNRSRYFTDFDGDTKSDLTVYRPSAGTWWSLSGNGRNYFSTRFGLPTDRTVAGNYDGDNKADIAVYREGVWYILQSSDGAVRIDHWGLSDDIPVQGDYDNDGKMNTAVFRPSEGVWYLKTDSGYNAVRWGISTDKPVAADYDGDGKTDIAVYRASEGNWYILRSSDRGYSIQNFGLPEDKPVPADYDGDGKTDIAVYRPSEGVWYISQSSTGAVRYERFGLQEDIPVPNDFDGDSKSDIAVYRPSEGVWYILNSSDNSFNSVRWGTTGDLPIKTTN